MYEHSPYKYTYTDSTYMSTFELLGQLDLKIHEVGHQKRLAVDRDIAYH
jgi:hypothetical protein